MNPSAILVTGFGAFEAVTENPSGALARSLDAREDVRGIELPVSFRQAPERIAAALDGWTPLAVLSLGVHPGPEFRLERRARAALDPERVDNEGTVGSSLGWQGPDLETSLDLEALRDVLREGDAPEPSISEDAGRYVCECVYRKGLEEGQRLGIPALFLHVPPLEHMGLERQEPVLQRLVDALLLQLEG